MGAIKPSFRPSTPDDRERVANFLQTVFGSNPNEPYLQPAHMQWKYWQARGEWQGSRSYLLEREGQIVAHGAAWPIEILAPGHSVSAFHFIDWAADPKLPGAGISIMKRMAESADVICVFGGSEAALKMRAAMGFRPRNKIQVMARPLRPFRQSLSHQTKNWKSAARFFRNLRWSVAGGSAAPGWQAASVRPNDLPLDVFPAPGPSDFVFEQNAARLSYMADCPTAQSRFYLVTHQGTPAGFFHLMLVPGQARLADAWVKKNTSAEWQQLYRLAVAEALKLQTAYELVSYASNPVVRDALQQAGFHTHHEEPVLIFDPKQRVPEQAQLHLQMVHGDAAFWHRGTPLYLT